MTKLGKLVTCGCQVAVHVYRRLDRWHYDFRITASWSPDQNLHQIILHAGFFSVAQLSQGKTRYSLYSSCCSSGPSRSFEAEDFRFISKDLCYFLLVINSNLGRISHRFRDMAGFSLKNTHFLTPPPFNSKVKNVSFPLDR